MCGVGIFMNADARTYHGIRYSWHQILLERELQVVVTDCCGFWELNEPGLSGRALHVEPALQRYWMHLDYGFYFGLWLDYIVLIFCYFSVLQFCYMFYFSGKVHMYPNVLVEVRGVDFLLLPYRFLGLILGGQTWWEVPFTCWPTLPSLFVFCLMILVLNLGH